MKTSVRNAGLAAWVAVSLLIAGCGGGGGGGSSAPPSSTVPGAPRDLVANVGDRAVSLGWNAPTSDGGAAVQSYDVVVVPTVPATDIFVSGTRAVVRNLSNATSYVVSVHARNSVGQGQPVTTSALVPRTLEASASQPLTIQGDTSVSGVFDPALMRMSNGDVWMSYSSVHYYNNASGQLVQDVGIRLARSTNGGADFSYQQTIATPAEATVTDTDPARSACGTPICTGRWVYETSWLIDDATDPDPSRRFKLFAHKYFLRPGGTATTLYHLGAIVMWTAASPQATWSTETSLLGWSLTPPELTALRTVNALHADLASCITVAEGGASVSGDAIDFVFACPYPGANPLPQKIVMLRSTDHASNFQYVSTLLTPADAAPIGAGYFTAPAIATSGNAPLLLVTPTVGGLYAGCVAIPFADAASLFRASGVPLGILYAPPLPNHFGGACAYDPAMGSRGILQNDGIPGASLLATQFRIRASGSAVQAQ